MIVPYFGQELQLVRILNLVIHCFNYLFQLYVTSMLNEYSLYFFPHVIEQIRERPVTCPFRLSTASSLSLPFLGMAMVRFSLTYYDTVFFSCISLIPLEVLILFILCMLSYTLYFSQFYFLKGTKNQFCFLDLHVYLQLSQKSV